MTDQPQQQQPPRDPAARVPHGQRRLPRTMSKEEARQLDVVQRAIWSSLIIVVCGLIAGVLALYLVVAPEGLSRSDVIVLWIMTGFIGVLCAAGVLLLNRRKPYSPWVLLGLLPMVVSAYWILR